MILNIAIILCFQLVGEVLSRAVLPFVPGPVLGLVLLLAACAAFPRLHATIRETATGLLAHLSLLFVPAGVGVVSHWGLIAESGPALLVALIGSTVLALLVGVGVFRAVARITEGRA
ncbi:CidA/LrgA family protein [Rhodobacterales bacterium HKCCE3408]|nr:CidA/LrgA family protein [Rhodobacterales bacterium HKCCE3408]